MFRLCLKKKTLEPKKKEGVAKKKINELTTTIELLLNFLNYLNK